MKELAKLLGRVETELRDLEFMARQRYIVDGPKGNSATRGQLEATIHNAMDALSDAKIMVNEWLAEQRLREAEWEKWLQNPDGPQAG